jgi:hypothetical protein
VPAVLPSAHQTYTIRLSMREGFAIDVDPAVAVAGCSHRPRSAECPGHFSLITKQPQNAVVSIGQTATFSVTVDGTGTIT